MFSFVHRGKSFPYSIVQPGAKKCIVQVDEVCYSTSVGQHVFIICGLLFRTAHPGNGTLNQLEEKDMAYRRYNDENRLITDRDQLQLTNGTEVVIYSEDAFHEDIVVDLEGQADRFEELKPLIVFAAANLCEMDCVAQEYDGDEQFADHYEAAYVSLDAPDRIRITYFGACENTEFDVVFQRVNNDLVLKSFGMAKDIAPDWYIKGAGNQ